MDQSSVKKVKRNVVSLLAESGSLSLQDDPPSDDGQLRRKVKVRTEKTDASLSNKEVEGNTQHVPSSDEADQIQYIEDLMTANNLALTPSPPTKGDGNCWFRAMAEQVEFHNIPDKARNFKSLRLEVRSRVVFLVFVSSSLNRSVTISATFRRTSSRPPSVSSSTARAGACPTWPVDRERTASGWTTLA